MIRSTTYIEQEESYTSKSSFIDNDIFPEYKVDIGKKCKQNFTIEELSSGLLASPKHIRVA